MRLLYERLGINMTLELQNIYSLVIESKAEFMKFVQELWNEYNGISGQIFLSDADKKMNVSKEAVVVINPFDISLNDKKIVTQVYKDLMIEAFYCTMALFLCQVPFRPAPDFSFYRENFPASVPIFLPNFI